MGILSKLFNSNALSIIAFSHVPLYSVILWNRATIEALLFNYPFPFRHKSSFLLPSSLHKAWTFTWNKQKPIVSVNIISRKLCTNLKINSKSEFMQPKWSTVDLCLSSKFHLFVLWRQKIYFCIISSYYFYANERRKNKHMNPINPLLFRKQQKWY